jgi:hypothetical protein
VSILFFFLILVRGNFNRGLRIRRTTDHAGEADDKNDEDQRPANDANGRENSIKRKIIRVNSRDSRANPRFSAYSPARMALNVPSQRTSTKGSAESGSQKGFLQKATKEAKAAIWSKNLRYLRFLLLILIGICKHCLSVPGANRFERAVLGWSLSNERREFHFACDQIGRFEFSAEHQCSRVAPNIAPRELARYLASFQVSIR